MKSNTQNTKIEVITETWCSESMSEVKRIMQKPLITEESSILRNHSSLVMMRPDS